eukprot:TRINITY_DN3517_c0_g1_i1.p1 TRINITY_DN3517_c0_g1~~TRINITY_DN3517_c0_g1_i1.p1  ORF type:complete len:678 (-),score=174.06 TRINITY_DN3517_c0_g1_i1:69-2102(-)
MAADMDAEAGQPAEDHAMLDAEVEAEEDEDIDDVELEALEAAACAQFEQASPEEDPHGEEPLPPESSGHADAGENVSEPEAVAPKPIPKGKVAITKSAPKTPQSASVNTAPVKAGKSGGKIGKSGKAGKDNLDGKARNVGKGGKPVTSAHGSDKAAGKGSKGAKAGGKKAGGAAQNDGGDDQPKGKGKAKSASDGGIGKRVVDLNRAAHWQKGSGIDVQALVALRGCDPELACSILDELESEGAAIENPSRHIRRRLEDKVEEGTKGDGKSSGKNGKGGGKGVGKDAGKGVGKDSGKGKKRPTAGDDLPPAKRAAVAPAEAEWEEEPAEEGVEETWEEEGEWNEEGEEEMEVELSAPVANKLQMVQNKGLELNAEAVSGLAAADDRDALVVLEALCMREKTANPSDFVIVSLRKRAAARAGGVAPAKPVVREPVVGKAAVAKSPAVTKANVAKSSSAKAGTKLAEAKAPVSKAPAAKAPVSKAPAAKPQVTKAPAAKAPITKAAVGKAPVAKGQASSNTAKAPVSKGPAANAPGAKAPVAKAPVAKAAVAKAPVGKAPVAKAQVAKAAVAKAPVAKAQPPAKPLPVGSGKPPKIREGLDWQQDAVQSKVLAMNKSGCWEGEHPLDEAVLSGLLRILEDRAFEILQDIEEEGSACKEPSARILELVEEEEERVRMNQD